MVGLPRPQNGYKSTNLMDFPPLKRPTRFRRNRRLPGRLTLVGESGGCPGEDPTFEVVDLVGPAVLAKVLGDPRASLTASAHHDEWAADGKVGDAARQLAQRDERDIRDATRVVLILFTNIDDRNGAPYPGRVCLDGRPVIHQVHSPLDGDSPERLPNPVLEVHRFDVSGLDCSNKAVDIVGHVGASRLAERS